MLRNKSEDIADPGHRHKLFKHRLSGGKTPIITQAQSVIKQTDKEESGAQKGKRKQQRLDTENRLL
ncbi:MAG: hypothetical protein ACYC2W_11420, partial [Desulfurivibrionaceae bacterium]